ncbi:MAG TPA: hypothetical protein VJB87_03435 [Candidatus Nanoarchaeia archaeon]|nr:hypothetical protein [Candidatus Nanoarchaeia archaeon]
MPTSFSNDQQLERQRTIIKGTFYRILSNKKYINKQNIFNKIMSLLFETRKKTLEHDVLQISFSRPIDRTQVEILCLFLAQRLPVSVNTVSIEKKTWERNKPACVDHALYSLAITQEDPQTELLYHLEEAFHIEQDHTMHSTQPRSYRGIELIGTTPEDRTYDRRNAVKSFEFRGFSPAEECLIRKTRETVQAYFREHF